MSKSAGAGRFSWIVDTVLTVAAFVVFYLLTRSHVPSHDPLVIRVGAALTASCMTGVFWLALQMFKVTLAGRNSDRTDD